MRILLHICCGPCAIMPLRRLLEQGHEVSGYFYNPNIQPLAEYLRRREGAEQVADKYGIKMHWALAEEDYDSVAWLRRLHGREQPGESGRCALCWGGRLRRACQLARELGYEAFSTSLLYSRHQPHRAIADLGAEIAAAARKISGPAGEPGPREEAGAQAEPGPLFFYQDFRQDWQEGIDLSREWGVYRQQYCGCLFSENERYARELARANRRLAEAAGAAGLTRRAQAPLSTDSAACGIEGARAPGRRRRKERGL